jgi:hypothetical protein
MPIIPGLMTTVPAGRAYYRMTSPDSSPRRPSHFSSAIAAPNEWPRQTSRLAASWTGTQEWLTDKVARFSGSPCSPLARFGPTTPTRPPRLPLAPWRLDRVSCCRILFATERLSPSACERAPPALTVSDRFHGTPNSAGNARDFAADHGGATRRASSQRPGQKSHREVALNRNPPEETLSPRPPDGRGMGDHRPGEHERTPDAPARRTPALAWDRRCPTARCSARSSAPTLIRAPGSGGRM